MNNYDKIPIENIYYMLCYAKNRLKANAINKVSQQDYKNLYDLFGEILYNELSSNVIPFSLYTSINFSSIIAFSSSFKFPKIKLKNPINLLIFVAK